MVYRGGNLVYKVFDRSFPKADILNEALNQARIEETGLPIPGISKCKRDGTGRMDHCSGIYQRKDHGAADEGGAGEPESVFRTVCRSAPPCSQQAVTALNKLREKLDRQISTCEALSPNTRFIIRGRLDSMPKHACVLHGDFNPGNIIVSEDGTCHPGLVSCDAGNASADATNTYLLTLEDAETADQYSETLLQKESKTAKHYVQQWLSIAAASRKTKGIPEEEKLLNHWLNVLEYE